LSYFSQPLSISGTFFLITISDFFARHFFSLSLACLLHFFFSGRCSSRQFLRAPILPKVTNIGLQIFVTCTFYIFVAIYQYFLVGQVFRQSF
jgi:hypothetical protein